MRQHSQHVSNSSFTLPSLNKGTWHNWDIWAFSLEFKRFLRALDIKKEYFLTESFYALQIFVSNIFIKVTSMQSTWHVSAWWDSPTDWALAVVMVGTLTRDTLTSHGSPVTPGRRIGITLYTRVTASLPHQCSGHVVKLVTDATADQHHCYPGKSKTDTNQGSKTWDLLRSLHSL